MIGALGIVLFDHAETSLQPLMGKFALLQRDLDEARRELASQRNSQGGQRQSKYTFASFVGASPAAVEVKRQARRAAQTSSPVLLLGETGTGKELLAHAIHAASARAAGPLISLNIAAVPDTLLEAEFFGVAPGAYTGADRKGREGKFRLAHGGTLFLDEIGDMPLGLQAKLLRALQEGEIEPLGSNKLVPFDARVIAATSRDLARLVREGKFREDLFYRLNVLPLRVPPLRERRGRHCRAGRGAGRRHGLAQRYPAARADARGTGAAGRPGVARQHSRAAQRAGADRDAQRYPPHQRTATASGAARSGDGAGGLAHWRRSR